MTHSNKKHSSFDDMGRIPSSINVDQDKLKEATLILRAVTHKLRQRIIQIIQDDPYVSKTELSIRLRLDLNTITEHLRILRRAKVLSFEKNGQAIFYKIDEKKLEKIRNFYVELNQY